MDSLGQNSASFQLGNSYTQGLLALEVSSGEYFILHPQNLVQSQSVSSICDVSDPPAPSANPHELFDGSASNPPYRKGNGSKNLPSSNANSQVQTLTPSAELEMAEFSSLPPLNPLTPSAELEVEEIPSLPPLNPLTPSAELEMAEFSSLPPLNPLTPSAELEKAEFSSLTTLNPLTPSAELEMAEFSSLTTLNPNDLIQTVKPPHSFLDLIILAFEDAPEKKLTAHQIFKYVVNKFPFYRLDQAGWQNSIRHTLSVNHCFKKAGRVQSVKWKGSYWTVDQSFVTMLKNGKLQGQRKMYACDSARSKKMDDNNVNSPRSPMSEEMSSPASEMSPHLTAAINAMMSDGASTEVSEDLSPPAHYTVG